MSLLSSYYIGKGGELVSCTNIRGGFSFCGIDIATLGLSYAPDKDATYVYKPSESNIHEETFDGHNGGYFYGVSKQPKEFTLRCYFEDSAIDKGVMEKIYSLFRVGKSGKLIFDRRPWCYYYATVTSSPAPEITNMYNGLITITMKAYYPYARSDSMYILGATTQQGSDERYEYALETTALFDKTNMSPATSFTNINQRTSFILNNPGTERAQLSITVAGNAGLGFTIRNNTTNQECRIIAMDRAHTTNVGKAVYIDGINGKTSLISLNNQNIQPVTAFAYHDSGFIDLEPSYPAIRNVFVSGCENTTVTLYNTLYEDVTGYYIFMDGNWHKIIEQIDEQTLVLEHHINVLPERTMITKMNEIEVIPDDTINLSKLIFTYKPTFA